MWDNLMNEQQFEIERYNFAKSDFEINYNYCNAKQFELYLKPKTSLQS